MNLYGTGYQGKRTTAGRGLGKQLAIFLITALMVLGTAACLPINPEGGLANPPLNQNGASDAVDTEALLVEAVGNEGAVRAEALTLDDGTVINYTVILPPNYMADTSYPTLLALPPGSQTQSMVDAGLDSYWRAGALATGWVVISPVAPNDQLFFRGSERYLPEFLTRIAIQYPPEGEKFHLSGVSNGGISAFRVAGMAPERFHSLLALPGYAQTTEDKANLAQLTAIPVALFVGANDAGWIDPMRETASLLNNQGGEVTLEIVADEGHFIRSLIGGSLLFAQLEDFRAQ